MSMTRHSWILATVTSSDKYLEVDISSYLPYNSSYITTKRKQRTENATSRTTWL
jgi:hypothetical protein